MSQAQEASSETTIVVLPHPSLDLAAFVSRFDTPLRRLPSPDWLCSFLDIESEAPVGRSEDCRLAVRAMLRVGGYKPAGRGKPASEYLVRAAENGYLSPINLVVDVCNAVSLHSGLPISVVDLAKAHPPFEVRYGEAEEDYIFNASGQVIRISGLLCLSDVEGACANAVKDAQRTKTDEHTQATLSLIWGVRTHPDFTRDSVTWYRSLIERAGGMTEDVLLH